MKKQAAARRLGVSARTLERLTTQGRIGVTHMPGKRGVVADYNKDEVERLRETLRRGKESAVSHKPASVPVSPTSPVIELARFGEEQSGGLIGASYLTSLHDLLERLISVQERQTLLLAPSAQADALQGAQRPEKAISSTVDPAHKLTLSIIEAAALAGLSANHLREAIKAGKLKAKIVGRGWKIRPEDLRVYVEKVLK
jgi:excisionase family DNA binding protein